MKFSDNDLAAYNFVIRLYWLDVFGVRMKDKVRDFVVIIRKIDDCECFLMVPNAFIPNSDDGYYYQPKPGKKLQI